MRTLLLKKGVRTIFQKCQCHKTQREIKKMFLIIGD